MFEHGDVPRAGEHWRAALRSRELSWERRTTRRDEKDTATDGRAHLDKSTQESYKKARLSSRRQVPRRRRRRARRLREVRDRQDQVRRALEGREARRRDQRPQRQHE